MPEPITPGGLVEALRERDVPQALAMARSLSIDAIVDVLDATVAPELPETCDAFIEAWLLELSPYERLAAASKTSHIYLLELFWLPHAADKMTKRILEASALAMTALEGALSDMALTAGIPEASFDRDFAKRFKTIGETEVRALARMLGDGSRQIPTADQ